MHRLSTEQVSPSQQPFESQSSPSLVHRKHAPFRHAALQHSLSAVHAAPCSEQHMPPQQPLLVHSSFWMQ